MQYNPQIPISLILIMIAAALLLTSFAVWKSSKIKRQNQKIMLIAIRAVVIIILGIILLNPVRTEQKKQTKKAKHDVILLDGSTSMNIETPQSRLELLKEELASVSLPFKKDVSIYQFDTIARNIDTISSWDKIAATGDKSNLAKSIRQVVQQEGIDEVRNLIICSDGRLDDKEELNQTIALARRNEIPISVMGIGKEVNLFNVSIKSCQVDQSAGPNTNLPVNLYLECKGSSQQSYQVKITDSKGKLKDQYTGTLRDGIIPHQLKLNTGRQSEHYKLQVVPLDEELTAADNQIEFDVAVSDPRIRVLYMEGTNADYPKSVNRSKGRWPCYRFIYEACKETGKIDVDVYVVNQQKNVGGEIYNVKTKRRGYPKTKEEIWDYDVVICSDINRFIFSDDQLKWTRDMVAQNGGGFCMIGGITSFGSGGWDKTSWEKMIPVDMKNFGRGEQFITIYPTFPEKALKHPIMQFSDDPNANRNIITTHPPFKGTNMVNRAKPGATVLAYWKQHKNMPLICVQSYGKGRSMAFTSDAAGGWGEGYQDGWGSSYGDNNYYRKFWANTVLWLAENSLAHKDQKLQFRTNQLSYFKGENIKCEVNLVNGAKAQKVEVRLANTSEAKILTFDRNDNCYKGNLRIPDNFSATQLKLICRAMDPNSLSVASDSLKINVKQIKNEYKNPNPDFASLQQLMMLTGGQNLKSGEDIAKLLETDSLASVVKQKASVIPIWDQWFLFAMLLILLTIEWIIRKFLL
ncbi:hypothetical protein EYV94_16285 [Puteibacter caeruleilacunae]|nr:hypothetical protein EYV94_16285 [Puteibacter caeruleilacunae]